MKKIILLLSTILFSCTKEVNINIPQQDTKLVVNCLFNPDSLLKLKLRTTQSILEDKDTEITKALVKLFEDDTVLDTLKYKSGAFISAIQPKPNTTYSVTVNTSTFSSVSGADITPSKPNITPLFFLDSISRDVDGDMISQVKFKITDNSPLDNFYELDILAKIKNPLDIEPPITSVNYPENNDPVIMKEDLLKYFYDGSLLFSDELFKNKSYELAVNYWVSFMMFSDTPTAKDYDLIIRLKSVSKNYYNYKKTLIKHYANQEEDIWDGLGSPISMFTNIENGYGVFAAYNEVVDTIYKKK